MDWGAENIGQLWNSLVILVRESNEKGGGAPEATRTGEMDGSVSMH